LGRVTKFEFVNQGDEEGNMAIIKKPPQTVNRSLQFDQPVSDLLDDYARFVDCTPDYVANFALRKTLARDPEYKKWRASRDGAATGKGTAPLPQAAK
jgi:hypothetical protein